MNIPVGISACVMGQPVRFDGGHKQSRFVTDELGQFCKFEPVCPEVAVGMGTPRPTIRLVQRDQGVRLETSKKDGRDFTDKMIAFSGDKVDKLAHLCGYIVCAKSPTCGMERVKLYADSGHTVPGGTAGLFTHTLMQRMPWLPVEEDGRLNDPILRENFVARLFALQDLYVSTGSGSAEMTRGDIVNFHARYKLDLMAHSPVDYKELGSLVASIADYPLYQFFDVYRLKFMTAMAKRTSRRNITNVLQHLQGYFKRNLTPAEKNELSSLILAYNDGFQPLLAPLTLVKHYINKYPDEYLASQVFLKPHPEELKLRYAL